MSRALRGIVIKFPVNLREAALDEQLAEFTEQPIPQAVFVQDSLGNALLQLQSDGNVIILEGNLLTNQTAISSGPASDFIVRGAEATPVTQMLVDGEFGDLLLKGSVTEDLQGLTENPTISEFVIRGHGEDQIVMRNGDLLLRGRMYIENPN